MKPVYFEPQNFGGFTLAMLLSGGFLALAFKVSLISLMGIAYLVSSIVIFFVGMYFFSKDN